MDINLNFADIPEGGGFAPLDDGPTRLLIKEATYEAGEKPFIQLMLAPNVPPSSPIADKQIRSRVYLTAKSLWKAKEFFEAVYQRPFDSAVSINVESLAGMPVIGVLKADEASYTSKKDGTKKTGIFSNVEKWEPDVAATSGLVSIQ